MIAGVSAVTFNAQNKSWDFKNFTAGVITADYTTADGLSFVRGGSDLTIATNNLGSFVDGFVPVQRLAFGGNSYSGSTNPAEGTTAMPTRRYVKFDVPGPGVVKLWGRGGNSGRSLIISEADGKVLKSHTYATNGSTDLPTIEYSYAGGAGTLLVSTGSGDNSLYKIEYIDAATMAVGDVKSSVKANAFSSGNRIYVSNLESKNTNISVYNANGSLVKSLKSSSDTNFEINTKGLYIVNLKSEAGEKSVKVLIK